MICPEPGCTGKHGHVAPVSDWCPRTLRRQDEVYGRWVNAHPARHYLNGLNNRRRREGHE